MEFPRVLAKAIGHRLISSRDVTEILPKQLMGKSYISLWYTVAMLAELVSACKIDGVKFDPGGPFPEAQPLPNYLFFEIPHLNPIF